MALTKVSYAMQSGAPVNVLDFGADPTGLVDSTAAIQAAITTAETTGQIVFFPAGVYLCGSELTIGKNVNLQGVGKSININKTSLLKYTGADDFIQSLQTINTSSPINVRLEGLTFRYENTPGAYKSLVWQRCGTFFDVVNCGFSGGSYQLILDQTEICSVVDCDFEGFTQAGVWLTNGSDKSAGANELFTNRITIDRCQFNSSQANANAILDDGGVSHVFSNNNFNACRTHIRLCGAEAVYITGNEMEVASADCISTHTTKWAGGTPTRPQVAALSVVGNFLLLSGATAGALNFTTGSCISAYVYGNSYQTSVGIGLITGKTNVEILNEGSNYQRGAGVEAPKAITPYLNLNTTNGNSGTFTLNNAAAVSINNTSVTANTIGVAFPLNVAAALAEVSSKKLYFNTATPGVSFQFSTADTLAVSATDHVYGYLLFN